MKATIEFYATRVCGKIISTTNDRGLELYERELCTYHKKEMELMCLAYPREFKPKNLHKILNDKPLFDIDEKMKQDGYFRKIKYGKNGYTIYETPFAKIDISTIHEEIKADDDGEYSIIEEKIIVTIK